MACASSCLEEHQSKLISPLRYTPLGSVNRWPNYYGVKGLVLHCRVLTYQKEHLLFSTIKSMKARFNLTAASIKQVGVKKKCCSY